MRPTSTEGHISKFKVDPEQYRLLADQGYSNYAIADLCEVSEASVRRGLASLGYTRHLLPLDRPDRYDFDLDVPLVIRDENVMVAADLHCPVYNPALVNEMIQVSRIEGHKTLIMAGDFFNFDSLSQYDPKQDSAGLEREWLEGIAVMRVLMETYESVVYVWGNHDSRIHKALGYKLRFAQAMQMVFGKLGNEYLDRIRFTNLDHVWVEYGDHPDRRWYICHPQNYSRTPLATARRLAAKFGCNVITAHSHHAAVGYAENGRHVVAEAGGLFDPAKTAYLQRSTTFPTWQNGYSWLTEGKLHMASPGWTRA